jgi:hypothetical protein
MNKWGANKSWISGVKNKPDIYLNISGVIYASAFAG